MRNDRAVYEVSPQDFADQVIDIAKDYRVNIIGGCCGTTKEHIKAVSCRLHEIKKKDAVCKSMSASFSSLYNSVAVKQEASIFYIGERLNATGSKAFRELLNSDDWDSILVLAKSQVSHGAHMLDISVSVTGRNEREDMGNLVTRLVKSSAAPLMIDSYQVDVIEAALECIGGRPVVNSINLESGEEKLKDICRLCNKFGAGVVALAIDEEGMAKTAKRKVEIIDRIIKLAVKEGLSLDSIFIDPLIFTIATGNPEDRNLAVETLCAIEKLSKKFPKCQIILGLSNVSFGLDVNARKVLNSVFLDEAVKKGVTSAIINPANILSLHSIDKEILGSALELIYNKNEDALLKYIKLFTETKFIDKQIEKNKTIEERLIDLIVNGDRAFCKAVLSEALKKYKPLEIINDFLLKGMKIVGELFEKGKMQLPFVLQSAEVMRASVEFLEAHFSGQELNTEKGSVVLATVYGDVHDIGKDLVEMILSSNGFKVYNITNLWRMIWF